MDIIVNLLGAISWPVVALVTLIAGGFGWLNKPLTSISDGIVKFVSEFRKFKKELETTEATLKGLVDSISKTQEAISQFDISSLKSEIQDVTTAISDLTQRDMLSAKEALETTAEARAEVEKVGEDPAVTEEADPHEGEELSSLAMLSKIEREWKVITDALRTRAGERHFDGRAIAETAYALVDNRRRSPLTQEQAKLLATMHSQFKSYTRRRATVEDWMTRPSFDSFMDAAKVARAFLK